MTNEELIVTLIVFGLVLFYLYKSLFKKNACGTSCGCASQKKNKKKEKDNSEKHC